LMPKENQGSNLVQEGREIEHLEDKPWFRCGGGTNEQQNFLHSVDAVELGLRRPHRARISSLGDGQFLFWAEGASLRLTHKGPRGG
jgi:hypothetical protein